MIGANQCEGKTNDGERCPNTLTREFPETPELPGLGHRCRHHAEGRWPKPPEEPEAPKPTDPPVSQLKSLRDAERIMAWVTMEVAFGRMDKDQALPIIQSVREWRASYGDRKLKREQNELRQRIKQIKREKSERNASRHQKPEDDDDD